MIISNIEYLGTKDAVIDKDEFSEMRRCFERIKREAMEYVEDYIAYVSGVNVNINKKISSYSIKTA